MAYLGYKNKIFREYKREQERIKIWKIKYKAEQARKRKRLKQWKTLSTTFIIQLVVVALIIAFYGVFASALIAEQKGSKVGVGNFVMAVSYTDSYNDLQYVANFVNCDMALDYYNMNCTNAKIMMCQNEDYLYMPIGHNSDSSFDFEPTDKQSCGFVGVQKPKFIEE
jgi:ABC-type multidrug transport system fused ATPase/permease subunit